MHSCPPLPPEERQRNVAFNPGLDTLPQPLPPALTKLNINFCNFTRLPHDWPVGLIGLMAVTSKVAEFPATLSAGLQSLYLTNYSDQHTTIVQVPGLRSDACRKS